MPDRLRFVRRSDTLRRLILLEEGADKLVPTAEGGWEETIAIAQLPGERPIDFADRALHRIATLERFNRSFRYAELHTAASDAPDIQAARRLIALGIAAHAESTQSLDELVVCAPAHATWDQRVSLLELADELLLCSERKPPLAVRLRFLELQAPQASAHDGEEHAGSSREQVTFEGEGRLQMQHGDQELNRWYEVRDAQ